MRPRSVRGWHWYVVHVTMYGLCLGFGFILGYLAVRLPNGQQDESMPAPSWLLWTGILLCLAAVVTWAMAVVTAPLYDPNRPSVRLRQPGPIAQAILAVASLSIGLVVSAIVSSESAYRGVPFFFVGAVLVAVVVTAWSNRS